MEKYKFLEKEAIADVAYEAYGNTYSELFKNAALAVFETTADINTVEPEQKRTLGMENDDIEDLLHEFLSEIVFIKDRDSFVFHETDVEVTKIDDTFKLSATLRGEPIDQDKHDLNADIKAVTMHMFNVEETDGGYKAKIVLDV